MFRRILIIFIQFAVIVSRDLSENERASRAAFIQRLLNKQRNLEARVKLLGGSDIFEGENIFLILNRNMIF